jgi:integrase/recombinase XerD
MKQDTALLEYIKGKYSPSSVNSHYNNVLRYLTYIGDKALRATYQDVLNYIEALRTQRVHPKTLRNYLFGVKIYYNYLQTTGQRQDHPCKRLYLKDQINRDIPIETLYSEKQLEELMNGYQCLDEEQYQRNIVIISLLVYQALNIREISNLQMRDIDLDKGQIFIRASIQLKARTLPLKSNQIMLFYNYINGYRKKTLDCLETQSDSFIISWFGRKITESTIRYILRSKTAPEGEFTTIKIRQSVIANLLKKNDIRVVQVFAGHKHSSATEAYKQSGIEELKDDIRKVHPLR